MALYDMYEDFQIHEYTDAQQALINDARERDVEVRANPNLIHEPLGTRVKPGGDFTPYPLIGTYIAIAKETAAAQLEGHPPMPEDQDVSVRFPGVDPVGSYSVIDMKFAQREAAIRANLESRTPEVQAYVKGLMDRRSSRKAEDMAFNQRQFAMKMTAKTHRELTRACKLCPDAKGRQLLHQQARMMETDLAVTQYDMMMQGIEYAAGVRQGPVPKEIADFYKDTLGTELDMGIVAEARSMGHAPERIHVEFQDLDHKLIQRSFANPRNWGKSPAEIAEAADNLDIETVSGVIPPYARATVDRSISPVFDAQEKATQGIVNRTDLIIIDGKTVREKMFEDYTAAGMAPAEFDSFFKKNYVTATNEYVAAGLMAGKRVEAFIPDKLGRIPDQPTQITKTGYEPTPLKPVKLSAWERHFSKYGYYKEKVERKAEYERMMAARERVKSAAHGNEILASSGTSPVVKDIFFGGWARDNGGKPNFSTEFSIDRSALHTFAVSRMLMEGRSLEDIYDPNALLAEKDAMGREVCERLKAGDMKWAGETMFHGLRLLGDEINQRTAGLDFANEAQAFSREQTITKLAATTAFDLCQECERACGKQEFRAAAQAHAAANNLGDGKQYLEALHSGVNAAVAYFNFCGKVQRNRPVMAGGLSLQSDIEGQINNMVNYEMAKKCFAAARAAQPGKGMCELFRTVKEMQPFYSAFPMLQMSDSGFRNFLGQAKKDPQLRQNLGRELMSGRLQERMKVNIDPKKMTGTFKIDPPTKKGDMEFRSPDQLAAAKHGPAKQNKPPQMTGPKR